MKIINFTEEYSWSMIVDKPVPAIKSIPDWFKKMPSFSEGSSPGLENGSLRTNTTMKKCMPFLDALGFGYTYLLPADIEITKGVNELIFKWRSDGFYVDQHLENQYLGYPALNNNGIWKWISSHAISVPPGYSVLYTHPLNRHDLPFRTFSGVVDADKYSAAVNYPFEWINNSDRYILEAGTPLVQIIPFKRDSWNSKETSYNELSTKKRQFSLTRKIVYSYRKNSWTRKIFR